MPAIAQVSQRRAYPEFEFVKRESLGVDSGWHLASCRVARRSVALTSGFRRAFSSHPRVDFPIAGMIGCRSCRQALTTTYGDASDLLLGNAPEGLAYYE